MLLISTLKPNAADQAISVCNQLKRIGYIESFGAPVEYTPKQVLVGIDNIRRGTTAMVEVIENDDCYVVNDPDIPKLISGKKLHKMAKHSGLYTVNCTFPNGSNCFPKEKPIGLVFAIREDAVGMGDYLVRSEA